MPYTVIINAPQAIDQGEGQGTAEVNGAGPSAMVVEKDVVVLRQISVKITPTASIMRPTAFIMRSIQFVMTKTASSL